MNDYPKDFNQLVTFVAGDLCIGIGEGKFRERLSLHLNNITKAAFDRGVDSGAEKQAAQMPPTQPAPCSKSRKAKAKAKKRS